MRIIDLRGQNLSRAELLAAMPRAAMGTSEATDLVRPILDDVKERGAAALRDFEEKFDHVRPKNLRVPVEAIKDALTTLDPEVRAAIEESVRRARAVAANQVPKDFYTDLAEGARVAERWIPIQRVGLYVPGGKAVYPSSVIMNAVPAQAAGVESLAIATPPARDNAEGLPNKTILATCAILGVDEVYAVGGAQAIAMFAYGAKGSEPQDGDILCDPVDKITGPGNAFVAAAKKLVSGDVGIDMVAGPSEVCVLADATAKPMVVAADLMAQAEHDPLAACYLVTCDEQFAREVEAGIDILVAQAPRAEITRASLDNEGTIVVAADMAAAVEAVNTVAPEHLELHCKDAMGLLGGIRNAGAIFVGAWSSEPLGDYVAGPNHTLPTGGTAMFSNPLSVEEFVKRSSVICYTPEGLLSDAPATQRLAEAEGLWAHALSAALRRRVLEQGEDAVSAESLAAADLTKVAWPGDAVATVAEGVDLAATSADGAGATDKEA